HQRHRARGLGKPLIPADSGPDAPEARRPHFETGVPGAEVVLLLIAGAVGDVGFTIDAEVAAIGIQNRYGIEERGPRALEEAYRQHDSKLARDARKMPDGAIVADSGREIQVPDVLLDA